MVRIGKGGSDFLHIYPLCDAVFFYVYHPSDFFYFLGTLRESFCYISVCTAVYGQCRLYRN